MNEIMDEEVFQEHWNRIKYIGEMTIYHYQKKYEEFYKEYEESCAERKWLQRCSPTQFLDENEWFRLLKEYQLYFENEASLLCCDLLDDENDPL